MAIKEGSKAPAFNLEGSNETSVNLADIPEKFVVLFFYPKDNTPGCTLEAKEFSKMLPKFQKAGAAVFGLSGLDVKSKDKFCDKYGLKIPLLADPDFEVAKKYDCYGEKSFMGRKYNGISRKTFVIDEERKIAKIFDSVKPGFHGKEVLEFINSIQE